MSDTELNNIKIQLLQQANEIIELKRKITELENKSKSSGFGNIGFGKPPTQPPPQPFTFQPTQPIRPLFPSFDQKSCSYSIKKL